MKPRIHNLSIKLIALVLAVATWFLLHGRTITESGWLECPVELTLPDNVIVEQQDALSIEIRVQGPVDKISDLRPTVAIDARDEIEQALAGGVSSATLLLPLARDDFRLPRRVALLEREPDSIQLHVQRLQRTVLPVEVATFGRPADGYEIVQKRATPSTVTLELGAESATGITAIQTTPVDVTGLTAPVHDTVFLLDPQPDSDDPLEHSVEVDVVIAPRLEERQLEPVPIMVLKPPNDRSRIEIDPGAIAIKVRGPAKLLADLGPNAAAAYVVIDEGITPGFTFTLVPIVIIKTPGVELDTASVPEVKLTVAADNE